MISDPIPQGTYGNIQNAACRPATVFNWIFANLFPNVQTANKTAAMCAVGDSAGSAAVAYSITYYGASNWFDNVELLSGPVTSDVEQGCGVGPGIGGNNPVTVCGQTNYMGGQYGCALGGGSTWTLGPEYMPRAIAAVAKWTNDNTCSNTFPTITSGSSNANWLAQSIVDQAPGGSTGATPIFNYPKTAMSAWLCRSVVNNTTYNCAANTTETPTSVPITPVPKARSSTKTLGSATLRRITRFTRSITASMPRPSPRETFRGIRHWHLTARSLG
jgi:hypothetical protein